MGDDMRTIPDLRANYSVVAEDFDVARKQAYLAANIVPRLPGPGARIVEIGPGRGELLQLLRARGHTNLEAFEVCQPYLKALQEQGFAVSTGSSAVPFLRERADASIDALVLVDVLEHVPRDEIFALLNEARRALVPGGRVIAQMPNVSGLFGTTTFFSDPTHVTAFNELSAKKVFSASGFERVDCFELALPEGWLELLCTVVRTPIFAGTRLLMRVVGAPAVKVLTHNLVVAAYRT